MGHEDDIFESLVLLIVLTFSLALFILVAVLELNAGVEAVLALVFGYTLGVMGSMGKRIKAVWQYFRKR